MNQKIKNDQSTHDLVLKTLRFNDANVLRNRERIYLKKSINNRVVASGAFFLPGLGPWAKAGKPKAINTMINLMNEILWIEVSFSSSWPVLTIRLA